ncbi:CLUMA_CG004913, isoform A [Clunio marinus]|uniref:CLUMA_CG004913, isoform A n=1 Tax=Clunio marinus TaxID=568069 RepID=A0A1J1HXI5_9DIPT|nr:CLUMA_CG004913, isoform A [Clunio marinus]
MSSCNIIYVLSLLALNLIVSVAKINEPNSIKWNQNVTDEIKLNENIFSEGNTVTVATKSRIIGRKGAIPDMIPELSTSSRESLTNNTTPALVNFNSSTTVTSTEKNVKISSTTTTKKVKVVPTKTTSKTTTTQKPTKAPAKKPLITFSADDNSQILESEKNINYNLTSTKLDYSIPKVSQDIDRTIIDDEKKTRKSYAIFLGIALAIPLLLTLIHVMYKKIKNWIENRHYQRVDFLVDGMYIS